MLRLSRLWSHLSASKPAAARPRRSRRHRPRLDALEGRQLLTLGPEFFVSQGYLGYQPRRPGIPGQQPRQPGIPGQQPRQPGIAGRMCVLVSASSCPTAPRLPSTRSRPARRGAGHRQCARRPLGGRLGGEGGLDRDNERIEYTVYYSSGVPVTLDMTVEASGGDVVAPAVAIDHDGNFVITWSQKEPDQPLGSHDEDILAKRFDAAGNPVGGVIPVAVSSMVEWFPERGHGPGRRLRDRVPRRDSVRSARPAQ